MPFSHIDHQRIDSSVAVQIKQLPNITREKEQQAFAQYFSPDLKSAFHFERIKKRVIETHLKLVLGISKGNADFFQSGVVALDRAFHTFDLSRGFRFATHARAGIYQAIGTTRSNNHVVKQPTSGYPKFLQSNLVRIEKKISDRMHVDQGAEFDEAVAQEVMGYAICPYDDISKVIDSVQQARVLRVRHASLNRTLGGDDDAREHIDLLPAEDAEEDDTVELNLSGSEFLEKAQQIFIDKGKEKHWNIFAQRRLSLDEPTLEDLGKAYGVSRERIRQIEIEVFERLQHMAEMYQSNGSIDILGKTKKQIENAARRAAKRIADKAEPLPS
ncbi:MAG: sigma factor-like helix-turn-helix DNA-binding protein [Pseudomonadota bacterium]